MAADRLQDTLTAQASVLSDLLGQALQPTLDRLGLTFSTFELLSTVQSAGDETAQAEIARRLGITPPSLTEAVRAAVKGGWLEQVAKPGDARAKSLRLTEAGKRALQEILRNVNQTERILVNGIEPAALRSAVLTLRQANRNLARLLFGQEEST